MHKYIMILALLSQISFVSQIRADPILIVNNHIIAEEVRYEKGIFYIEGPIKMQIKSVKATVTIRAADTNSTETKALISRLATHIEKVEK